MDKKTDPSVNLKGAGELHIKDVGVFLVVGKAGERKAYYKNGRPVEPGKLFLCEFCPFVAWKEIDFARHMVEKHPDYANGKTPEAKPAPASPPPTGTKLLSLDQMTKKELLAVAQEEALDVSKGLNKAELLAEIRAKMPLSNNPKYI